MKKIVALIVIVNFICRIIGFTVNINEVVRVDNLIEKDRLQTIKEKGTLAVAAASSDPPFYFLDINTQKVRGIDADIINEISNRLKINKVDFKSTVFSELLQRLKTDENIDIASGGMYIIPEREKEASFTHPLYAETEAVIVRKASKINFKDDLKNAVVGVEKGTIYLELVQKWKTAGLIKDIEIFQSISELLDSINNGKIDAGIADSLVVNKDLKDNTNLFLKTLDDYSPELIGNVGIAVRKNDNTLLNVLNEKIDEMKADGTMYAILKENGLDKNNIV
ncbi:ABC transporter substrate-binding protein [Clostridium beijerinckii]|uniref:Polar amino acid transport system substrate-binding protein n=1 Tax=Clostridium beijerinckii TaxID=1520 RepID=A0AAX0B7Y4_CLOBE|nr:ABC transporter substrate-binding protein [Clostridium beijerinckii]NRT90959.1 polar amino acid transport system substrate-binding protein [Clostridium beijerinckii]NYC70485.1 polar amino acid transport system substrate-binding protein [Clostridium beijerinckii]